jgi:dihydrolipoamide dehydrogenase
LNLEALGVTLTLQGAIPVDDNYQLPIVNSQLNGVYAIGDVNGRQMLAHAAEMQAVRAVNHILGKPDGIRFDIMPAAIFTTPEAACVGPTEDQLKEQGIAYECRKSFWRANGKALAMAETEGMLKLFVTPPSEGQGGGSILGCHAYGAHAADIVQEVSVLMCRDTTVAQLRDMVHIHPTLSEILKSAVD